MLNDLRTENIDFPTMKANLYTQLSQRNKQESEPFDDIIKDYNSLYFKYKSVKEKLELAERENNSLRRISGNPTVMNDLQGRIAALEKDLSDTMKDNNLKSTKLCEILGDKMLIKDHLDTLNKQNATKTARILELESIVKNQDETINKLREDNNLLKIANGKLDKLNVTLNENLNKKLVENKILTNEILKIKGDMIQKMNEMNEMLEGARKKKEAADIYYVDKQKEYNKSNDGIKIIETVKDFQVKLEDVAIPKILKMKFNTHKKGVTSLRFNNFGTNFISTGADNFVKVWDASKNVESAVFAGFTGPVTSACFDHTEQFLFAGSTDTTSKLWTLNNNKLAETFTGHSDCINCVQCYYSNTKGLTGSNDMTIKEWDFNSLKLSRTFNCASSCQTLGLPFDDSFILSGHHDGSLKLWSSNDKPERIIDLHEDKIIHLVKTENQVLTLSSDHTIKLFDLRKMETIYTLTDETLPQTCESNISVSSDKKFFAVGSIKGQIFIMNIATGFCEDIIDAKTVGSIHAIHWRPYYSQLYIGDSLGLISIFGTS